MVEGKSSTTGKKAKAAKHETGRVKKLALASLSAVRGGTVDRTNSAAD